MRNRTALYLRLSKDEAKSPVSESIQNQETFLKAYAKEHKLLVTEILVDDGYSGTRFDRPGFNALLTLIETGAVDVVLTKDLSRLGRDYIQTGYYLEQYFPLHNIRYIAVNDGIDTLCGGVGNDMSPFRAVFNDMYAKDISQKVRCALKTKKLAGQFVGSRAPYGYRKDPCDKNHLIVDAEAAEVVRRIYALFYAGVPAKSIAKQLTETAVAPPSGKVGGIWNDVTIRRILTNPTYIGHVTQNKSRVLNYKLTKRKILSKEEWITVKDTHEAVVSQSVFDSVQKRMESNASGRGLSPKSPLCGLVFCADCGALMRSVNSGGHNYFVCAAWRRNPKDSGCKSHCISAQCLLQKINRFAEEKGEDFQEFSEKITRITVGLHKEIEIFVDNLS